VFFALAIVNDQLIDVKHGQGIIRQVAHENTVVTQVGRQFGRERPVCALQSGPTSLSPGWHSRIHNAAEEGGGTALQELLFRLTDLRVARRTDPAKSRSPFELPQLNGDHMIPLASGGVKRIATVNTCLVSHGLFAYSG
jgi:hypothetical protein